MIFVVKSYYLLCFETVTVLILSREKQIEGVLGDMSCFSTHRIEQHQALDINLSQTDTSTQKETQIKMIRILSKFILILCLILDPVEKVVFFLQIGDEGFSKSGQPST